MLKNNVVQILGEYTYSYTNKTEIDRRDEMIYKVYYQELNSEIPVRERTKSLFVEAETERAVRDKLVNRNYNVEFIQQLDEAHLAYEKQSENFKMENV